MHSLYKNNFNNYRRIICDNNFFILQFLCLIIIRFEVMFSMVSYSYICLPYETPYERAAVPNNDFFQLFRIVFSRVNTLAIVIQDFYSKLPAI